MRKRRDFCCVFSRKSTNASTPFLFLSLIFFSSFPLFSVEIFTSHTLHLNRERTWCCPLNFLPFLFPFQSALLTRVFSNVLAHQTRHAVETTPFFLWTKGGGGLSRTDRTGVYIFISTQKSPPLFFSLNLKIKMKYLFTSEIYLSREKRKKYRLNRSHTHHQKLFYDWESFFLFDLILLPPGNDAIKQLETGCFYVECKSVA